MTVCREIHMVQCADSTWMAVCRETAWGSVCKDYMHICMDVLVYVCGIFTWDSQMITMY